MAVSSENQGQMAERMIAVVMSEAAATALAEACKIGKFRVEDWLDDALDARERAERAREWLDWGQRWLVDGQRIEVPE